MSNSADTPEADAACDERKKAFDEWYFTLHGVMPDLLHDDTARSMWMGWSAGMKCELAQLSRLTAELKKAKGEAERHEDALLEIVQWADAYPVDIFVPPTAEDNQKLHRCLVECGLSLDKFSADCMRHVVTGVGDIARRAIAEKGKT